VLIDPSCLQQLPQRAFRAGLAESLKHAVIGDESFLTWQESRRNAIQSLDPPTIESLVERNIRIKCSFVHGDTTDTAGTRIKLNFGHTLGHAIEAELGFELLHGECVSLGMTAAAWLSNRLGLLSEASQGRLAAALTGFGLPVTAPGPLEADRLLAWIEQDKKVRRGRPRLVLLEGLGRAVVRDDVPDALIRESIHRLNPT